MMMTGRAGCVPGHSRPAEKYSRSECWWLASGINIFGTLPNWHRAQVICEPFSGPGPGSGSGPVRQLPMLAADDGGVA